jgi:hypothetical protein
MTDIVARLADIGEPERRVVRVPQETPVRTPTPAPTKTPEPVKEPERVP